MINGASLRQSLFRGMILKCPRCGKGNLFNGYLKRAGGCSHCHESFEGLDADDGPAWLTMGLTVHIIVPLLMFLERGEPLPYWQEASILVVVAIACVLLLLPSCKGFFIAILWRTARKQA